ncbi:MAG: DPP IV N-terminal domain-containing protein [Chloroflexi bacterium]|nr:DPP IV N-terminal domain-containing protein [Chloroflexota bacterium]MBU1747405.1 DPP IV N-terminal domain-containing protein [Chloroflexota bacterium]
MEPAWSPVGNWIACWVFEQHALMLLNRDGERGQYVTDKGNRPSWSPDGQRLVYERWLSSSDIDICLINRDGTGFQALLEGSTTDRDPAWSPDGHRIAFASNRDGAYNIYVMNVDGTQITQLTHATGDPKRGMIQPTWSPDSTRIAFVCSSDSIFTQQGVLYVVDAVGGEPKLLLDADRCFDPAWSPDGTWLAFSYGDLNPSGPLGSDIYLLRMEQ